MSAREFVYPSRSVHVTDGEPMSVPVGAGPPFPHVVVGRTADGQYRMRHANDTDAPEVVREPGNGPDPDDLGGPPDAKPASRRSP